MTSCRAKNEYVNGKFIQQRGSELAAEHYHEPHLKSLQYDIHRYYPYNIREPLSYPAVSIAAREPTRGPRVHYCYSAALQNGSEYAENRILSSIIYGPHPHRHIIYLEQQPCELIRVQYCY